MKKTLVLLVVLLFIFSLTKAPSLTADASNSFDVKAELTKTSTLLNEKNDFFTENKGQWNSSILFAGHTNFGSIAFSTDGIYYQLIQRNSETQKVESNIFKLSFMNPTKPILMGEELLTHYNNYISGSNENDWKINCRNFRKISYQNVWKGIDLSYFFTPEGIKYEFYLDPTGNINDLQMKVEGATIALKNKSLHLTTNLGTIQDINLKVFDQLNKNVIPSNFSMENNVFSFSGIPTKRENTVIIDPLIYSTYIGGSENDQATSIAVDSTGCAYIAGLTNSSLAEGFPVGQPIWFDTVYGGNTDAFVAKLNPGGTDLLYTTYIGGSENDQATSIAVDSTGCAYIAGLTNSSLAEGFPVGQPIWFDTVYGGMTDAFIAKLNPGGTSLLYNTYIGGSRHDQANSIAIDSFGCAYIAGYTDSSLAHNFPVGQPIWFDTVYSGNTDAFVVKINPTGTNQIFGTYLGGSQDDRATSVAVDTVGNVIVAGYTNSSLAHNFPVGQPIWFDTVYGGNTDAFVVKLNSSGTTQIFGTYLGGSQDDRATSVAVDTVGNVLVAGYTDSSLAHGFPVGQPIWFDTVYGGNTDAFVVKLNSSGTTQIFGTYLGGSEDDRATSVTLDSQNNVYVAGYTDSSLAHGFPVGQPIWFDTVYGGNTDAFMTKLDPTGISQLYGTYIGGSQEDIATSLAVDSAGCAYIAGYTDSSLAHGFPVGQPIWFDTVYGGNTDAFVSKIEFGSPVGPSSPVSSQGTRLDNSSVQITWQASTPGTFPISKYLIYRSTTNLFDSAIQLAEITNLSSLSWIDTDADVKTTYYYWITALDSSPTPMESEPSLTIRMLKQVIELICSTSPTVDVSIVNLSGQRTGFYQGSYYTEIPNTAISPDSHTISFRTDSVNSCSGIRAELVGNQSGSYHFSMILVDKSGPIPITTNLYSTINRPIQMNQIDVYELDWTNFIAEQPYMMNIKKDFNGDTVFDQLFSTPFSPGEVNAILDFDLIHLNWKPSTDTTYSISSYSVFRSLDNQLFTLLSETNFTFFTDDSGIPGSIYYYRIVAKDVMGNESPFSPVAFAGPTTSEPKPDINLSVVVNKTAFYSGESVLFEVTVGNSGFREVKNAVLTLTLPPQIKYVSNNSFFGELQPSGQVEFLLGTINRRSSITFQINASLATSIIQETSVTCLFDLQSNELETIRKVISILLLPTKSGSSEPKISVSLKNILYDTETGTYYLTMSEILQMEVKIDGFTSPHSISINWGDGMIDVLTKQSETSKIWEHQFTSKGTMTMSIKVVDSIGRTKEVSVRLQIR